jgi:hypothetical protein
MECGASIGKLDMPDSSSIKDANGLRSALENLHYIYTSDAVSLSSSSDQLVRLIIETRSLGVENVRFGLGPAKALVILLLEELAQPMISQDYIRIDSPHQTVEALLPKPVRSKCQPVYIFLSNQNLQFAVLKTLLELLSSCESAFKAIQDFITLLRDLLSPPPRPSSSGLFGELILLKLITRLNPNYVRKWSIGSANLIDISSPSDGWPSYEVKTYHGVVRHHHTSLAQLSSLRISNGYYASMQISRSTSGMSCSDLYKAIRLELLPFGDLQYLFDLNALIIESIPAFQYDYYDPVMAINSLRLYDHRSFIQFPETLPPATLSIQYVIDFECLESVQAASIGLG